MLIKVRESGREKRVRFIFLARDLVDRSGEVELGRDVPPPALLLLRVSDDFAQARLRFRYAAWHRELCIYPS